jgi:hypothetical protein
MTSDKFILQIIHKKIKTSHLNFTSKTPSKVSTGIDSLDYPQFTLLMGDGNGLCKKLCLYVSQQYGGYRLKEIGAYYGMRGSAVSRSNRRVKEKIDRNGRLKRILRGILKDMKLLIVET